MNSPTHPLSLPPSPYSLPIPSSPICCPELDLSVTLSPNPKTGHTHLKPPGSCLQSEQTHLKHRSGGHTKRKKNAQVCFEEPLVVTVTKEPPISLSGGMPPSQPLISRGKRRGGRHGGFSRQRAVPPAAVSNDVPGCLEEAELNTTLALKAELQSLQGAEFNSQKAVQERLQTSERTKNLINTRATEGVNVSRSQLLFTSLVSIEVQQDDLISQVLQDRLLLAPPPRSHDTSAADSPSPLLFMTSDLLRQKPLPPEEEPVAVSLRPCPCPTQSTFDLYSRRRRWEAVP